MVINEHYRSKKKESIEKCNWIIYSIQTSDRASSMVSSSFPFIINLRINLAHPTTTITPYPQNSSILFDVCISHITMKKGITYTTQGPEKKITCYLLDENSPGNWLISRIHYGGVYRGAPFQKHNRILSSVRLDSTHESGTTGRESTTYKNKRDAPGPYKESIPYLEKIFFLLFIVFCFFVEIIKFFEKFKYAD